LLTAAVTADDDYDGGVAWNAGGGREISTIESRRFKVLSRLGRIYTYLPGEIATAGG